MESIFSTETLSVWLIDYGSIALFILLALGILALPIPEETLMVAAGVMIQKGLLRATPTLFAAYGGSICGMTLSYVLGLTAGSYFLEKGTARLGLSRDHLERAHNWFERFGTWALMIGYFIPGVRHFTGFAAGSTRLEFSRFAFFAYTGALVWATFFIAIGYYFGNYVLETLHEVVVNVDDVVTLSILIIAGLIIYRLSKDRTPDL